MGAGLFIMFGMDSDFVCRNFVLWCGIYVTDHWTEWTQSYSGFFNHEFGSRILGGIWLADSWAEAEYKGDTGMLSDFFGDHFSAAAGTAKSKICR